MMRFIDSWLVTLFLVVPITAAGAGLPTRTLSIGGHRLTVEIAATPEQRATGLMNRFSLQPDHGMLFVFEAPQPLSFWMKDTYVPLSIAFVDTRGRISRRDWHSTRSRCGRAGSPRKASPPAIASTAWRNSGRSHPRQICQLAARNAVLRLENGRSARCQQIVRIGRAGV